MACPRSPVNFRRWVAVEDGWELVVRVHPADRAKNPPVLRGSLLEFFHGAPPGGAKRSFADADFRQDQPLKILIQSQHNYVFRVDGNFPNPDDIRIEAGILKPDGTFYGGCSEFLQVGAQAGSVDFLVLLAEGRK